MLSMLPIAFAQANPQDEVATDLEAFMLFMADSITDEGQLLTPLDLERDVAATDAEDDAAFIESDEAGMEEAQ